MMFFKHKPELKKMGSSGSGILFGSSQNLLSGTQLDSSIDPDVTLFVCFPPSETPVGLKLSSSTPSGVPTALTTVTGIADDSCASKIMVKGDTILRVNDEEPKGAVHASELVTAARKGGVECNLKVLRPRSYTVTLTRQVPGQPFGLKIGKDADHLLITDLAAGGLAMQSGQMCKGCRLVKIDGTPITASETASDVASLLRNGAPSMSLTIAHDSLSDVDLIDSCAA
jgi:C-terminal processing protease CtpA/Prc